MGWSFSFWTFSFTSWQPALRVEADSPPPRAAAKASSTVAFSEDREEESRHKA